MPWREAEARRASAPSDRHTRPRPEWQAPRSGHRGLLIAYFSMRYVLLLRLRSGRFYQIVLGGLLRVNAEKAATLLLSASAPVVTAGKLNPAIKRQKLDGLSLASVVAASSLIGVKFKIRRALFTPGIFGTLSPPFSAAAVTGMWRCFRERRRKIGGLPGAYPKR